MNRLPDELVLVILRCLDLQDLVRSQQVSRRFLALARDISVWKELCYTASTLDKTAAQDLKTAPSTTTRALWSAQWEPAYPADMINYVEEYVHAHAEINTTWRQVPGAKWTCREITGLASLTTDYQTHAVCPVDDGSVLIYDMSASRQSEEIAGHSKPGLLTPLTTSSVGREYLMTKATSYELVSVDQHKQRAYFAVDDYLQEVDLASLSLLSSTQYDAPISAISTCGLDQPLVVATSNTVHVYDSRDKHTSQESGACVRLPEPSPSSMLHLSRASILVAGRFSSMLEYSLRYFPRVLSTIHSGAQVSSLTSLPFRTMTDRMDALSHGIFNQASLADQRSLSSYTIVSAGAYKGKGSLEMYSRSLPDHIDVAKFVNRYTAAPSKLLSVATHGAKLVTSDGNGTLRWYARDGRTNLRTHCLEIEEERIDTPTLASRGLWGTSGISQSRADIIRKLLPFKSISPLSGYTMEKLLLWTGEGRLGVLGYGPADTQQAEEYFDSLEVQAESAAERAKEDAERQYAMAMRRALERNADEVRFVRGLGMADYMI